MKFSVKPNDTKASFVELYGSGLPPPLPASLFIDL